MSLPIKSPMPQATLHSHIEMALRTQQCCVDGDCLIVGVSGGADSVALLDLLATLPHYSFRLIVAHLNHLLRGAESDADEQFVAQLAAGYGLPCEIQRCDTSQLAKEQRLSLEEAGRLARYRFFDDLKERYQATAVAVAHHADDQAETFLLRLLRGAGSTGLAAMSPLNHAGVMRPLLTVSRQQLRDYLAQQQLDFREDSSNTDQSYLRNRVRHELLPLLQEYTPGIAERLAATAQLLAAEGALLDQYTTATFTQLSCSGTGWVGLSLAPLKHQPQALRLRLYRHAIATLLGNRQRFELRHFNLLDSLLNEGGTGNRMQLPCGLAGTLTADHLLLAEQTTLQPVPPCNCTIHGPGSFELGNGLVLSVSVVAPPPNWSNLPAAITYADPGQAPFPWQVRPIVAGERLELLGMQGSRAIQDILTDQKIPRYLRRCLPVVCQNAHPLWLAGIRRTRHALLHPGHQQAIRLELSGQERLPLFP